MTRITNLRPGCVGIDLQPPLKPMRRDEDRWLRDDPELTLYSRMRRKADRRFVLTVIGCALLALIVIVVPLFLAP